MLGWGGWRDASGPAYAAQAPRAGRAYAAHGSALPVGWQVWARRGRPQLRP